MAMPDWFGALRRALCPGPSPAEEVLDHCLAEAFWDEAVALPPRSAWDRLRSLLERRRVRPEGMWVLYEPLRDPPETLPTVLSTEQYCRALRLYSNSRPDPGWQLRRGTFDTLFPTFGLVINL